MIFDVGSPNSSILIGGLNQMSFSIHYRHGYDDVDVHSQLGVILAYMGTKFLTS